MATAIAAAAIAATVLLTDANSSDRRPLVACGPKLDFEHPERFRAFKLYALGCGWRGHRLDNVLYANQSVPRGWPEPRPRKLTIVDFLYGTAPRYSAWPLAVQIWPACQRNRAIISLRPRDTTVRGVPAAWYEGRGRLEIYTGRVTIVLFGSGLSSRQLREAADDLEGVNNSTRPDEDLPPPVPGAIAGKLKC